MRYLSDILAKAGLVVDGVVTLNNVANATIDTDKFLVIDSGVVKYRSGTQMLSDIGAAAVAAGLPVGGTAGQILAKIDGTNYNAQWIDNYAAQLKHIVKLGENMTIGTPVYVSSADGTNMIISKASYSTEATSSKVLGLLAQGGVTNDQRFVITEGLLAGIDTSSALAGDPVWLGPNGTLLFGLANKPVAPNHMVYLGVVTRVQQNNGEIFVKVQNGFEIDELHDVLITSKANKDLLYYDSATTLWKNASLSTILGYTPNSGSGTTNYVTKWTSANALGNSQIFDNGTNVGVGTASPNASMRLQVSGQVRIDVDTSQAMLTGVVNSFGQVFTQIIDSSGDTRLSTNRDLIFRTSDVSERMRVTSTGKVLIGKTTESTFTLDVSGGIMADGGEILSISSSPVVRARLSGTDGQNIRLFMSGTDGGIGVTRNSGTQPNLVFHTESGERMRITAAGNVGIGTASPATVLNIRGSSAVFAIDDSSDGTSKISFRPSAATYSERAFIFVNYATAEMSIGAGVSGGAYFQTFYTNGTERLRITSTGNVGIGTTSPNTLLELSGAAPDIRLNRTAGGATTIDFRLNGNQAGYISSNSSTGEQRYYIGPASGWGGFHTFYTDNVERMRISSTGHVGIGVTPSPWSGVSPSLQLGVSPFIASTGQYMFISSNVYYNGTNAIYTSNGSAASYSQSEGNHTFSTAFSGTSGAVATFAERMRITSGGNVGVSTTSPSEKLHVVGNVLASDVAGAYPRFISTVGAKSWEIGYRSGTTNYEIREDGTTRLVIANGGNVGVGTTTPAASARLDVTSTTQGFLPPRMTATQRAAITSPAVGLVVYQTDGNEGLWIYTNTNGWKALAIVV